MRVCVIVEETKDIEIHTLIEVTHPEWGAIDHLRAWNASHPDRKGNYAFFKETEKLA